MKILSINLKPSIIPSSFTDGKQIITGHVTVDQYRTMDSLARQYKHKISNWESDFPGMEG